MVVVSIQVERVSDIDPKVTREKFYCILLLSQVVV